MSVSADSAVPPDAAALPSRTARATAFLASPSILLGGSIVLSVALLALFAPLAFTTDPIALDTGARLRPTSLAAWFGTDMYGRDVYSRVVYGCRTSLGIGLGVAVLSVSSG